MVHLVQMERLSVGVGTHLERTEQLTDRPLWPSGLKYIKTAHEIVVLQLPFPIRLVSVLLKILLFAVRSFRAFSKIFFLIQMAIHTHTPKKKKKNPVKELACPLMAQ